MVPPSIHRPGVPAAVVHNPATRTAPAGLPNQRVRATSGRRSSRTGCPYHAQLTRHERSRVDGPGGTRWAAGTPSARHPALPRPDACATRLPSGATRLRCPPPPIGAGQHEIPGAAPGYLLRRAEPHSRPDATAATPASSRLSAREPALQRGAAGNSRPAAGYVLRRAGAPGAPVAQQRTRPLAQNPVHRRGAARNPRPAPGYLLRHAGPPGAPVAQQRNLPARALPPANPAHRRGAARNPRPAPGYLLRHAGPPGAPVAQQRNPPARALPPANPAHRRGAARNPRPAPGYLLRHAGPPGAPVAQQRNPPARALPPANPAHRRGAARNPRPAPGYLLRHAGAPGAPGHSSEPARSRLTPPGNPAHRRGAARNPGPAPGYLLRHAGARGAPVQAATRPARALPPDPPRPDARVTVLLDGCHPVAVPNRNPPAQEHKPGLSTRIPTPAAEPHPRPGGTAANRPARAYPPENPAHRRGAARNPGPAPGYLLRHAGAPGRHGSDTPANSRHTAREPSPPARCSTKIQAHHPKSYSDTQNRTPPARAARQRPSQLAPFRPRTGAPARRSR